MIVAASAFAVVVLNPPFIDGAAIWVVGWLIAGGVVGYSRPLASDAFMDALIPGWIGFAAGLVLGFLAVLLPSALGNFGQTAPVLLLSPLGFVMTAIPVGFVTGTFAAITAAVRTWMWNRGRAKQRLSEAAAGGQDPEDPFGWRGRS